MQAFCKIFLENFLPFILSLFDYFLLLTMRLMTVKEYAKLRNRSIKLIYKEISNGKLSIERKYGVILIKVSSNEVKQLT